MATKAPEFPFSPKSTAQLKSGMIWDIPLRDGSYACGRVLHLEGKYRKRARFDFWGGLLRWHASVCPSIEAIAGAPILWQGTFDVRSLARSGSRILDILPLECDGLVIPPVLTSRLNGMVMIGYDDYRPATDEEFRTLPIKLIGEDNDSFRKIAEEVFLDGKPMRWERSPHDNAILDLLGMKTPADLAKVKADLAKEWRTKQKSRTSTVKSRKPNRIPGSD